MDPTLHAKCCGSFLEPRRRHRRIDFCELGYWLTCIAGRINRTAAVALPAIIYRRRHRVENFFQRIKRYRGWKSRETDAGLVSLVDVNGINEAYAADRSGHH